MGLIGIGIGIMKRGKAVVSVAVKGKFGYVMPLLHPNRVEIVGRGNYLSRSVSVKLDRDQGAAVVVSMELNGAVVLVNVKLAGFRNC